MANLWWTCNWLKPVKTRLVLWKVPPHNWTNPNMLARTKCKRKEPDLVKDLISSKNSLSTFPQHTAMQRFHYQNWNTLWLHTDDPQPCVSPAWSGADTGLGANWYLKLSSQYKRSAGRNHGGTYHSTPLPLAPRLEVLLTGSSLLFSCVQGNSSAHGLVFSMQKCCKGNEGTVGIRYHREK